MKTVRTIFLVLYAVTLAMVPLYGQSIKFNQTYPLYNGDISLDAIITKRGYLVTGLSNDSLNMVNLSFVLIDTNGVLVKKANYSIYPNEYRKSNYKNSLHKLTDSTFLFGCPVTHNGKYASSLVKLNWDLDTLWTKIYFDTIFDQVISNITLLPDDDIISIGSIYNNDSVAWGGKCQIIRYDSLGNIKWKSQFKFGTMDLDGSSILYDSLLNKLVFTGFANFGIYPRSFIAFADTSGSVLGYQYKFFPGSVGSCFMDLKKLSDGNYLLTGIDYVNNQGFLLHSKSYIVKTDQLGNTMWQRSRGSPSLFNAFYSSIDLPNGNICSVGEWGLDTINPDPLGILCVSNSNGDSLYSRFYRKAPYGDDNILMDINSTNDNGFLMTGYYLTSSVPQMYWLIKTDSTGCDSLICNPVHLKHIDSDNLEFGMYPNPSDKGITIRFKDNFSEDVELTILNSIGTEIKKQRIQGTSTVIDLTSISDGIYFLFIMDRHNQVLAVDKLIVHHN